MPFQVILPWIVMLPMLYGGSLVGIPLLLALLVAAIGLSAMQYCDLTSAKAES